MTSYLRIENLSKSFGTLLLFKDITFQIAKGQKIAIIAPNGTGKTTLFNIISGKDTADSGKIEFQKDISIGILEQEPGFDENKTVLEQVFSSSTKIVQIIEEYEKAVVSADKTRIQQATEQMDITNAWDYETQIKQILSKLKISDLEQKMGLLSGGFRKRIALANSLIKKPDLLILDEPTNHLDVEMTEWLEEHLKNNSFTILMVTHDRYFLDRICNEIIELDNQQLYQYKGNFSYYLAKRSERLNAATADMEKARNLMRKELDWIQRMPKARGTKAKYRVNAFEQLKKKATESFSEKQIKINIRQKRLGSKIIEINKLNKNFEDIPIVKDFSYRFSKFEKVGIIGANGSGKTTFLNLITGNLKPDSGSIETGETISFGYYKQEGLQFDETKRVIDIAHDIAEVVATSNGTTIGVSQFLTQFLFPPSVQYNYVYKLSGGEKRRLYLLTVLMRNPNFLILDEPTNDLDILTLNILEEYIQDFTGCILITSHDRYFLDKLVDHIFVFEGNGIIKDFPGNYSDYCEHITQQEQEISKDPKPEKVKTSRTEKIKIVDSTKMTQKERREFDQLSQEIDKLENEKKTLEQEMSSGNFGHEKLLGVSKRIGEIISLLDQKSERWLELSERSK